MITRVTKKAEPIIKGFGFRELAVYNYILTLLATDCDNFNALEIASKAGDDKEKIREGYAKVTAMHDRALYILQCLGLTAQLIGNELTIYNQ